MPKIYGRRMAQKYLPESYNQTTLLELKLFDITLGYGKLTSDGFVLLKGSFVKEDNSSLKPNSSIRKIKDELVSESKLKPTGNNDGYFELQTDICLGSQSAAGMLVKGYACSGNVDWKNSRGVLLEYLIHGY